MNMKRILLFFFFLIGIGVGHPLRAAQSTEGLWTYHLSYQKAEHIVTAGNVNYFLCEGNLMSYDVDDQSIRLLDKLSGLSDRAISHIQWSTTENCLVILYKNNNIDLLYTDGDVVNIPQIKNYMEQTIEATNLNVNGEWACIATTQGVVVLNLSRREIKGYYLLNEKVNDATVAGNEVFASVAKAILKGKLTDNLYDKSQWEKSFLTTASRFVPFGDAVYLIVPNIAGFTEETTGLCYISPKQADGSRSLTRVTYVQLNQGAVNGKYIQFAGSGYFITINPEKPLQEEFRVNVGRLFPEVGRTYDGSFWIVEADGRISNYRFNEATSELAETGVVIPRIGPHRGLANKIRFQSNQLLVAGGKMDYATGQNYPPMAASYEDGKWTAFPETGFTLNNNARFQNVLSVVVDPQDSKHHFVSCTSGLLEFRDFQFVKHYNSSNSPLEIAPGGNGSPNYTIVDGLSFDYDGNLWMTNYEMEKVLKVLKKDGNWVEINDPAFAYASTPDKTLVDSKGRVWVASRRTTPIASGLYGLDVNGTLDQRDDDRSNFRSTVLNEDGRTCDLQEVKDVREDKNGQIWFGCLSGVYVIQRPDEWFSGNFMVTQPKVPRNDGTNYADYLLTGIDVTAIAVDGGNRKWLGTMGSGVYLVNPDGSEVLAHYTEANSPLLSDEINSMAINEETGELFIASNAGICSFRTNVTSSHETLAESNVKIFPNPVRPEYSGNVTIAGLTEGAEVKILSTGSQLVARGNAVGGSFVWDVCQTTTGRRVAPGVYYVMVATHDGKKSVAGKIVVI